MKVAYPRKFNNMSARDVLKQVVREREIHLITLNRYRYNEQHSCTELTDVIEKLNGKPKELVQDLARHVSDEARHARLKLAKNSILADLMRLFWIFWDKCRLNPNYSLPISIKVIFTNNSYYNYN